MVALVKLITILLAISRCGQGVSLDKEISPHNDDPQCSSVPCARKCCPKGKVLDNMSKECVSVENRTDLLWTPKFTDANYRKPIRPPENLTWLYGFPDCRKGGFVLYPENVTDKFILLNNGKLFRQAPQELYLASHYCIENFMEEQKPHTRALVCFSEKPHICTTIYKQVYPVLLLVSSVSLGVTLVIYICLPDIRDRLHSRCRISLLAALFVAYTLLATTRLASDALSKTLRSCFGFVTLLGMLAAFFWLNVMCFDMWRTLRKTRIADDGNGQRRFLLYSLYAWGCPLLITIVAVIMEHLPDSYNVIRPNLKFGWFRDAAAYWVYMYGWMMALVVANVVFFILVAVILIKAQRNPLFQRSREYNRERMWLYAKLFVVMGVTWLGEVVSTQINAWQITDCTALMPVDIINALQGFNLFVVFVFQRAVLKKLQATCGCAGSGTGRPSTLTSTLSFCSASSSACGPMKKTIRAPVDNSSNISRSSSPNTTDRNVPPTVPMQTLRETPDGPAELSHGKAQETATMIPDKDSQVDRESGANGSGNNANKHNRF